MTFFIENVFVSCLLYDIQYHSDEVVVHNWFQDNFDLKAVLSLIIEFQYFLVPYFTNSSHDHMLLVSETYPNNPILGLTSHLP